MQYEGAVESLADLITAVNSQYLYVFASKAFLRYHCLRRDQVVGHSVAEVLGEEVFQTVVKPNVDRCLQGQGIEYEMKHHYPELGERYLWVSYYPHTTYNQEYEVVVAVIRDITERKQMEEALQISTRQWQTTFNAISHAVCLLDLEGRILQCNTVMSNLLGRPLSEINGSTCWELVHGTSTPIDGCPIVRMRETHHRETLVLLVGD